MPLIFTNFPPLMSLYNMYKFYEIQGLIFLSPSPLVTISVFSMPRVYSCFMYKFICIIRGLKRVGHDLPTEQQQPIVFFRFCMSVISYDICLSLTY